MGGELLVNELRAMHSDLPILIASNDFAEALRARFADDRCVAVINKPYNAAGLQSALDELKARCGAHSAGRPPDVLM